VYGPFVSGLYQTFAVFGENVGITTASRNNGMTRDVAAADKVMAHSNLHKFQTSRDLLIFYTSLGFEVYA
jgi:hypothetical protein